ncbi:MAG: hypothetical protein N4A45_09260 [Flavobacteriales bacterium]|jgi:hypothetical protein|nr:hypothetical protein [Flavobacteriales bacterium]
MKKLLFIMMLIPMVSLAQESRKDLDNHEISKGLYFRLNTDLTSAFDETFNSRIGAGAHFDGFHVGVHYLTSFGEAKSKIGDPTIVNTANTNPEKMNVKYNGFGLDLLYEVEMVEKFSLAPYMNMGLVSMEYIDYQEDQFLNTQLGAKLLFVPVRNVKLGLNLGYNFVSGFDFDHLDKADYQGLNFGITLQYNHFLPKW